ncbi:MAG: xylose isomerase [Spirochaetia bacterium]
MSEYFVGNREFFKGIGKIKYEGPESDNPLAFKFYDPDRKVAGKKMKDHFKFSLAYWHSFMGDGSDPFGAGTIAHPWETSNPLETAENKADACFEVTSKLGLEYYCFHDRDAAWEGASPAESERNLQTAVKMLKERQDATNIKLLWNTVNAFSHPRYANGAATNPDFNVLAQAGAQVKAALDANRVLEGENYVFWGGREGYMSLWNTDMKRELDHLATFLGMARDYGRKIGFKGNFLIEPKPMEPTTHQYDYDAATVLGFLRATGLDSDFLLNIEANHATLAGHTFAHDLQLAADAGMLGSIDANRGDLFVGWDTDQFPANTYDTMEAMLVVLKSGGLKGGGFNFDAKLRRNSTDPEDLFLAHIGGMDTFALGLILADKMMQDGRIDALRKERYASFDSGRGSEFEKGNLQLEDLFTHAQHTGEPQRTSGKQELIENIINQVLFS